MRNNSNYVRLKRNTESIEEIKEDPVNPIICTILFEAAKP